MAPKYERLPTSPVYSPRTSTSRANSPTPTYPPPYEAGHEFSVFGHNQDVEEEAPRRPRRREPIPAFDSDPRFRVNTPSPFARAALIAFLMFMFWLAFRMRKALWIAGGMGLPKDVPDVDPSY